jgi:hypothetical protein
MKADGLEYDERMARLEDITYPKPLAELLESAYEMYRKGHPWVSEHEVAPKSVVRDMFERAMTFTEYVSYYGLARSEGVVLRYLADAYRALRQTVPADARTEELTDLIEWLGELVRQVDSSLLDEWEQLRNPNLDEKPGPLEERVRAVTANTRAFRVLVRNALFRRVELFALRRLSDLEELDPDFDWRDALEAYFEEHYEVGIDGDARSSALLLIEEKPGVWHCRQILDDPDDDHDWAITAEVDLAASDEAGTAVLRIVSVDRL